MRSSWRARLGAETARLAARDLPDEMLRYARRENITQIVLGRSRAGWLETPGRPVAVGGDHATGIGHRRSCRHPPEDEEAPQASSGQRLVIAASSRLARIAAPVAVAVALWSSRSPQHWLNLPSISMVFLAGGAALRVNFGTRSAVLGRRPVFLRL